MDLTQIFIEYLTIEQKNFKKGKKKKKKKKNERPSCSDLLAHFINPVMPDNGQLRNPDKSIEISYCTE